MLTYADVYCHREALAHDTQVMRVLGEAGSAPLEKWGSLHTCVGLFTRISRSLYTGDTQVIRALGEAGADAYRELEFRRKMAVVLRTGTPLTCFTVNSTETDTPEELTVTSSMKRK